MRAIKKSSLLVVALVVTSFALLSGCRHKDAAAGPVIAISDVG